MNTGASRDQPNVWAFWLACAVAAVAGAVPIALAGTSGRVNGGIVPLLAAAIAYAGCALVQRQGRAMATGLYFLAGLATLYGILSMVAVPLRLAVIGTCPSAPAQCAAGFERPLTSAENGGLGFAAALAIVALFLGFFGLVTLYRRLNGGPLGKPPARSILPFTAARPAEPAPSPPVRRIPPVAESRAAEPEAAATAPEPTPPPTAAQAQEPELAAPEAPPELPAPALELELPAHGDASQPLQAALEPTPAAKPKTKRASRRSQGATPSDSSGT